MNKHTIILVNLLIILSLSAQAYNPAANVKTPLEKFKKYKEFYGVTDVLTKLTDNQGKGRKDLYGTRNFRVVLNGVAYRGGGNNYYHFTNPRDNKNPLPLEGLYNLANEGFSKAVYLYTTNFDSVNTTFISSNLQDTLHYVQVGGNTREEQDSIISFAYQAIINKDVGPVYYHCWNGWHQSGFVSTILLKQFCGYDSEKSVHYWEDATDGWNNGYDRIRDAIRNFVPFDKYPISKQVRDAICPDYVDNRSDNILTKNKSQLELLQTELLFPSSSSNLPPSITTFLDEYATILSESPFVHIKIIGHSDSRGDNAINYKLSYDRAKSVYNYLVSRGVDPSTLTYSGVGETELVNGCKDGVTCSDEEHAANRRVVFKVESVSLQVRYDLNSTQVPQRDKDILRNMFALISSDKSAIIEIQGYSSRDSVSPDKVEENRIVNQKISERRAKNIYEFLKRNGFDMSRVTYKGYGYTDDMKYNNDADRHIEFKIINPKR